MIALIGSLILPAIGIMHGRALVEKTVTHLLMPLGITWTAAILLCVYWTLEKQRRKASFAGLFVVFQTLTCSDNGGTMLVQSLENRFAPIPFESMETFDYVVVLGGGSNSDESSYVWLNNSGDRIMAALRMYHLGKAKKLIATGRHHGWRDVPLAGPAEETTKIWTQAGVPVADIVQLDGINTYQEMKHLRQFASQHPDARFALVTSAGHMARAMRLAASFDLQFEPVAVDWDGRGSSVAFLDWIPSSEGLEKSESALREYLAYLVGR
ncbi:MAG: YdcF family protein [Pirellulaceae bacterium]